MSGTTIVGQGSIVSGLLIQNEGTVFVAGTLETSNIEGETTIVGLKGGEFINDTIGFAATQILDSGAYASGTQIVGEYSIQTISAGATAVSDYVNTSEQAVFNYGTMIGATDVLGEITDEAGGVTNGTQLSTGSRADIFGEEDIYSGAVANNSTLNSGGLQIVYNGGYADHTVVNMGGDNGVYDGTEVNTTINSGGSDVAYGYSGIFGTAVSTTINSGGTQTVGSLGISSLAVVAGFLTAQSGGEVSAPIIEGGGTVIIDAGATLAKHVTFVGAGGTLKNANTHNLTFAGFTSGDEIFLSGTSIPKSKHVTLGNKGILTIGSIKETFVHGAGMVLNLTSTSSGVEITEKSAPADTSAASSSSAGISESLAKASPDIAANLWNNPKMEFLGTALTDNPTSETHLDNANFALLLRDDFNEADIIGLKGAASSELTLTHPTISAGAHITTLPLQTSIFSITTFSLG